MTNAAPIAPCPFCGSTDVATSETADERVYVFCGQCGSNGPTGVDAYASWRRLSELSAAPESVVPVVGTEARERLVERIYVAGGSEAERWEAEEAADDLIRAGWHDTPQVTGDMRERLERLRARGVAPTMTSEEHHDLMRGDPASAALAPPPDAIQAQAIEEATRACDMQHDQFMRSKGRNPADYTSKFSIARDALREFSPLPPGSRVVVIPADAKMRIATALAGRHDYFADLSPTIRAAVVEDWLEDASAALRALTEGDTR